MRRLPCRKVSGLIAEVALVEMAHCQRLISRNDIIITMYVRALGATLEMPMTLISYIVGIAPRR
jgi:hypothetical protein